METQLLSINFTFNVCSAGRDLAQLFLLADGAPQSSALTFRGFYEVVTPQARPEEWSRER